MAREYKKLTKKVKEQIVKDFKSLRGITGNGTVWCGPKGGATDQSVCIVQQVRNPRGCDGCSEYRR
jgi:hypothetical protein